MLTIGQLKFVTFNCVSLIDRKREQWVLNELLKLNADIVFLQEMKLASNSQVQEMVCFLERHFSLFHSNAIARSGGAAILIRKKVLSVSYRSGKVIRTAGSAQSNCCFIANCTK